MTKLSRSDFIGKYQNATLDVRDAGLQQKLRGLGVDTAKLDALADSRGKISGADAVERLFLKIVDEFDNDGSYQSINYTDAQGNKTRAGQVADALGEAFKGAVAVQIDNLTADRPTEAKGIFFEDMRGGTFRNKISFTFDDGPHPTRTAEIVDILKENGLTGTFFWLGKNIASSSNRAAIKKALLEGMEIANHTWDHPNLKSKPKAAIKSQIVRTQEALDQVVQSDPELKAKFPDGYHMTKFRAPYGIDTPTVRQAVAECGLSMYEWGVDTNDWKQENKVDDVVANALERTGQNGGATVERGGPLLMHDIQGKTPEALRKIIAGCNQKGVKMMSLTELAANKYPGDDDFAIA